MKDDQRNIFRHLNDLWLCWFCGHNYLQPMGPHGRMAHRVCLRCGHRQNLYHHDYGDIRYTWEAQDEG